MAATPAYDCIIVGGGISGLYAAQHLCQKYPTWRIAVAERQKGLGGRTYSYSPPDFPGIHWEMGAGRVQKGHSKLMKLIKEQGLHWVPISKEISQKAGPKAPIKSDIFKSFVIPFQIQPLLSLPDDVLANSTVEELLVKVIGRERADRQLSEFPQRAEVTTLRADLALANFLGGGEMGSHEGFGVLAEGFSELVARLRKDLEALGVTFLVRHRLIDLKPVAETSATDLEFLQGRERPSEAHGRITLRAKKACVLALHRDAVAELTPFRRWATLKLLKTQPLLRTQMVFPTENGKSWFSDLSRVVTPERPRQILPMNPRKGVLMSSYTDADDTHDYVKILNQKGDKALSQTILTDLRSLFPEKDIPKPLFFKAHAWETGCTQWLPGDQDPEAESLKAVHPLPSEFPGVYLCGESWSMRQAWVEGALEHTSEMLRVLEKKY